MDLLQLRYFQVAARTEHITRAAQELSIAQPSLSKTILHLEKEIGISLFDRHGRSIRLNQFGKAFLEHIETIFRELEEGQRKVGVAISPAIMKKQISEQGLLSLHLTNPTCQWTFGIAWHQKHSLSQAAHAFLQFIMEYAATPERV